MIINKVTIENFLCYFDVKEFDLQNGLNIILGDNGEGKTKFYEALDWLFNGNDKNLELLVSAKKINEIEINDQFRVGVSITVEQYGDKIFISKSFIVKKESNTDFTITNYSIEGIEENANGERNQVDGHILLDRIFPFEIRRYSMFKGESELNIFDNVDALSNLINSFSNSKHYDKYALKGEFLREEAEKAVDKDSKKNLDSQKQYKRLEAEIKFNQEEKNKLLVFSKSSEEQLRKLEKHIQEAEKFVDNAQAFETVNGRIKKIEEEITKIERLIDENYTTNLFDESWILLKFEKTHKEFTKKIEGLNSTKRDLQREFDIQVGIEKGKRKIKEQLKNYIPLPVGVPSKVYMEEMIKDNFCKVCGRDLDDNALDFMQKRLDDYLKSQESDSNKVVEKKILFNNDYLNRLFNLSISHEDNLSNLRSINKRITDFFEFNRKRREEIYSLNLKLEKELLDREKIIGTSSLGSDKLTDVLKNYNGWQRDIKSKNKEILDYRTRLGQIEEKLRRLNEEKDNIDLKSANNFLIKTRSILRDIEIIFKDTKEKKFDEFIKLLEEKSNSIFQQINIDDFTGEIFFMKKKIGDLMHIDIELRENDKTFYSPNQSLETSMHIAILFAISELASEMREENYPMIFDAPTSSFGETKTRDFLNLVHDTGKQRIILFYDFIGKDEKGNQYIKPEFKNVKRHKAFWLQRERPFDKNKLNTINTNIIQL